MILTSRSRRYTSSRNPIRTSSKLNERQRGRYFFQAGSRFYCVEIGTVNRLGRTTVIRSSNRIFPPMILDETLVNLLTSRKPLVHAMPVLDIRLIHAPTEIN